MKQILTDKKYWDNAWKESKERKQKPKLNLRAANRIALLVKKYIPTTKSKKMNAIEIGCYPGRFLKIAAELGYIVNGIDFVDNIDAVKDKLHRKGIDIGEIINSDFFTYTFDKKYDLVMSFGFIEHFINYSDVIVKHTELVADGGYLVITTPNYRKGLVSELTKIFSPESLKTHNIDSMNPFKWKEILENCNFEILFYGYFGGITLTFRYDKDILTVKYLILFILRVIIKITNMIPFIFESKSGKYSSHVGIIAKKINSNSYNKK